MTKIKTNNIIIYSIYDTIKEMTKKLYTHVQILENEKLVGIFSENTLLDIVNVE